MNYIWLIQFIFYGIEMTNLEKDYEVEDLEELDDNDLDGNNEQTNNVGVTLCYVERNIHTLTSTVTDLIISTVGVSVCMLRST